MGQGFSDCERVHGELPYQGPRRWGRAPWWTLLCLVASAACGSSNASQCSLGLDLDASQCAAVKALALPTDLPEARGNAYGDSESAALLGLQIFYDARFSANSQIRCGTCHNPEHHFSDGLTVAQGISTGTRNAVNLLNSAWDRWMFWDGRADTLWSQPIIPLETASEMGSTRLALAHQIAATYRQPYTAIFGPLPDLDDTTRFPPQGMPGDAAFDGMSAADQNAINTLAANVGKALEAYVRHVAAGASPLESFLGGNTSALTASQRHGLEVFAQAGCILCHSGPNLTDDGFHNIGVPAWAGQDPDPGRSVGLQTVSTSIFNSQGAYFDGISGRLNDSATGAPTELGAFKTPSLRNLVFSAPYGHNGIYATLEDAIDFHLQGGGTGGEGFVGTLDPLLQPHPLSQVDRAALVNFLQALVGEFRGSYDQPPNWWDWPDQ